MTAEGTACNGAGEAPRAEFAPEKAQAAAPEEEKAAAGEEDLGGPFVIVNGGGSGGDSDGGHSDRGSDLGGKAPDEDEAPSEEDDAPDSNAAPDADAGGGDHGPAAEAEEEGEVGAAPGAAALGASSADGGDRASDEAEGGAEDEGKGEPSSDCVAEEVAQQETVGEENGGAAALASGGSEPAIASADSEAPAVDSEETEAPAVDSEAEAPAVDSEAEAPAVDSEVEGKEGTVDGSAVADVAEVVAHQEASTEQDGDAAVMSSGHDDALSSPKSSSAALESEVTTEDSNEQSTTDIVEPDEQGTVGTSALVKNEHLCADMKVDSFVAATEPDSQEDAAVESCKQDDAQICTESDSADIEAEAEAEDSKQEQSNTNIVEVEEQGVGRADVLMANGHLCDDTQANSSEATNEAENHAIESKLNDVAESVEDAAVIGEQDVTDASAQINGVAESVEDAAAIGEQDVTDASSQTNGHINVALSADSGIVASESKAHSFETDGQESDEQQEDAPKTEAEVLEVALKPIERNCAASVEELVGQEVDTNGHDNVEGTADASREQEIKPMQVEGEATCGIREFEEVDRDGEQGLCDDSVVGVVSSNEETKLPIKETIDEAVPSVNVGESEEATEKSQDTMQGGVSVGTIFVKLGSDPYVESSLEHKVKEVDLVDEITKSVMETIEPEKVEAPNGCQDHEIDNSSEVELKKEFEMEVDGAVPLQEFEMEVDGAVPLQEAAVSAASVFHHEPRSIGLVENNSCNHSSPTTVLESCDYVQTEESRSQEISISVEQPVCSDSLEHGTMVVDEAAENGCKEKSSNEPVNLIIDELVVDDDQPNLVSSCEHASLDKHGCISKKDDSCEIAEDSRLLENGSPNEAPHLTEDNYENGNEPAKSSDVVETKCAEALVTEQKGNGHPASGEWHRDHAPVILPQKVYIIKVPKFAGDDLWNKIQAAQAHLDQLTQERDAINRRRQKQKAVCDQYREKLEAARQEEREARTAHGDKKSDLNSVRSVLGKLHQANSVEELDELIAKKEKTYQHETISFKEEKLLVKEINALKAQRKQLSATMGSKAEINEAFDQKDHIHERHKVLKKDSDVLFTNLKVLEENTRKIQKCFEDERTALKKLTDEHRAANEIRQKAYSDWTELRNEPSKKNEYFFKYRDARNAAETFRANGDTNGLISHCNSQIERVMEMWNQNEDFRKQYVESNKVSTLKRLGTHDGRRLGPDEDPPVIPSRRPSNIYPLSATSPEVSTLASAPAPVLAAPAAVPAKEDSFPVLAAPQTSKRAKSKASGSSAQIENNSVIVSEAEDLKQTLKEKARLLEEQLELARKAEELARKEEELRKERDAAEKERLRMEQKAKAKEAEERKRRKAEKDKERAEFKARKEAEEREKKKAKKDKKKGTTPADSSAIGDSNAAALATADTDSNASDNPREVEVSQPAAPKRLSRPAAAIKQLNRLQPMPAPLRNRGRRKLRQYILIAAAVLSVLALFVAGNYIPRLKSVHS